jgi:hypothetical protein
MVRPAVSLCLELFRESVRQQWNFNPRNSTMEVKDYKVDLDHVLTVELIIDPDLGKNQAIAALADWRIAGEPLRWSYR